jgi:hypothetical protein
MMALFVRFKNVREVTGGNWGRACEMTSAGDVHPCQNADRWAQEK